MHTIRYSDQLDTSTTFEGLLYIATRHFQLQPNLSYYLEISDSENYTSYNATTTIPYDKNK